MVRTSAIRKLQIQENAGSHGHDHERRKWDCWSFSKSKGGIFDREHREDGDVRNSGHCEIEKVVSVNPLANSWAASVIIAAYLEYCKRKYDRVESDGGCGVENCPGRYCRFNAVGSNRGVRSCPQFIAGRNSNLVAEQK